MNVIFKVKVFSGDGATFLRQILLHIPVCTQTGQVNATSSVTKGGANAAELITNYNTLPYAKLRIDANTTYFSGGAAASNCAFAGWNNVIGMIPFIGPGATVGSAIRLVFNNNSYIKITIQELYNTSDRQQAVTRWDYYNPAGTNLGHVYMRPYCDIYSNGSNNYMTVIPFAYPNENGVFEDKHLRSFQTTYYVTGDGYYGLNTYLYCWWNSTNQRATHQLSFSSGEAAVTVFNSIDLTTFLEGIKPVDQNDPYQDIPDSEPSGPAAGTGIPANDPVDIPSLPTASAIDTGFVSLFNPTLAQVKDLSDFMWTNTLFDVNNLKKIFADPMDCILGFNMVPVDVPSGSPASVTVGNIVTTVSMNIATSQWVEKDCGSINVDQWLGNYMDYSPDSHYSVYLPYIGIRELSTDDLVGKTIKLVYHVDVLSCSCIAFLKCGDSVLYEFAGQCGYSIPVTNNDFTQMIANICRLAIGVGGAVAGGGMSAQGVGNMVDAVMGLKPQVHRSGSVGGSTGLMGGQTPFLIMELPNICKPEKQYHYLGYPSFVTKKLSDLSGFASFESVILSGIPCTDEERQIILAMCREGIYL